MLNIIVYSIVYKRMSCIFFILTFQFNKNAQTKPNSTDILNTLNAKNNDLLFVRRIQNSHKLF